MNSLVKHLKNFEKPEFDGTRSDMQAKLEYYQKLNELSSGSQNQNECSSELYIEPLDWFVSKLSDLNGKVSIEWSNELVFKKALKWFLIYILF